MPEIRRGGWHIQESGVEHRKQKSCDSRQADTTADHEIQKDHQNQI